MVGTYSKNIFENNIIELFIMNKVIINLLYPYLNY
jgi:hypothetical protein